MLHGPGSQPSAAHAPNNARNVHASRLRHVVFRVTGPTPAQVAAIGPVSRWRVPRLWIPRLGSDDRLVPIASNQSVLLIPAIEMAAFVGDFRMRYDPSARPGIPPHITIMYPFLDPHQLNPQVLADLDTLFKTTNAFNYQLTEAREFEQGVLYLAPEPAQRFIDITARVGKRFAVLPFGGAFPTVVPHLTVTQSAPSHERKRIGAALSGALPQSGQASEVWLMVGHNDTTWKRVHISKLRKAKVMR